MTDAEALLEVAPELASMDEDRLLFHIRAIKKTVNAGLGQYGLALAVAHELTLSARGGGSYGGAVTSETEGQLSRTYASLQDGGEYFQQTMYGARFWALVRRSVFGVRTRMV